MHECKEILTQAQDTEQFLETTHTHTYEHNTHMNRHVCENLLCLLENDIITLPVVQTTHIHTLYIYIYIHTHTHEQACIWALTVPSSESYHNHSSHLLARHFLQQTCIQPGIYMRMYVCMYVWLTKYAHNHSSHLLARHFLQQTCIQPGIYIYIYIYIYMHMYVCLYVCMYASYINVHVCVYAFLHACACVHFCMHVHLSMYMYMHSLCAYLFCSTFCFPNKLLRIAQIW